MWTSPDGQYRNQIDYIPCSQRWRSSIQSAKTRLGADCGSDHELLLPNSDLNWRKWGKPLDHSGTNLDSILKSRDIALPTKICLVKAMVFPIVMYGCESWTIKQAKNWRIDAFELWCWRRLLRVPWTVRRSNQSILREINPEYSLEGLMLKLKLQYFGHLMWRANLLEKTLMLGKFEVEGDDRGWDGWMASPTQWTWICASSKSWWWMGKPGVLQSMGWQRVGHDWVTEQPVHLRI